MGRNNNNGCLRDRHEGMQIGDYETQYMENYDDKGLSTEKYNEKQMNENTLLKSQAWANRCIYQCALCNTESEFKSRMKFNRHLVLTHKMKTGEYAKKHGSPISYKEMHACQFENCSGAVSWDAIAIKYHLKLKHEGFRLAELM